jgi:hypothetical protein
MILASRSAGVRRVTQGPPANRPRRPGWGGARLIGDTAAVGSDGRPWPARRAGAAIGGTIAAAREGRRRGSWGFSGTGERLGAAQPRRWDHGPATTRIASPAGFRRGAPRPSRRRQPLAVRPTGRLLGQSVPDAAAGTSMTVVPASGIGDDSNRPMGGVGRARGVSRRRDP